MNCVQLTANRIIMLLDGVAYAVGTYEELKKSKDPRIMEFFN